MDNDFNINTNNYLPLREIVYNTLREAILNGKLQSEERLMENQLAQRLGVSRTPIREALRMLAQENLVGIVPRKGAQVLKMSEKDVKDIHDGVAELGMPLIHSNRSDCHSGRVGIVDLDRRRSEILEECVRKNAEVICLAGLFVNNRDVAEEAVEKFNE